MKSSSTANLAASYLLIFLSSHLLIFFFRNKRGVLIFTPGALAGGISSRRVWQWRGLTDFLHPGSIPRPMILLPAPSAKKMTWVVLRRIQSSTGKNMFRIQKEIGLKFTGQPIAFLIQRYLIM
jgi:hypothetical protein